MLERYVSCVGTDDAGAGEPAAIRARLRGVFAPAFGRRATILGLLIGGVLLSWIGARVKGGSIHAGDNVALENGTLYWHLVDLVWIFIFPLYYLIL